MPYKILRNPDGTFQVKNPQTGKVHAYSTTKKAAQAQIRLLESIDRRKK